MLIHQRRMFKLASLILASSLPAFAQATYWTDYIPPSAFNLVGTLLPSAPDKNNPALFSTVDTFATCRGDIIYVAYPSTYATNNLNYVTLPPPIVYVNITNTPNNCGATTPPTPSGNPKPTAPSPAGTIIIAGQTLVDNSLSSWTIVNGIAFKDGNQMGTLTNIYALSLSAQGPIFARDTSGKYYYWANKALPPAWFATNPQVRF